MSGDNFPNRYFPERYFPGGYFQGGEQNPGAMSASLSGSGACSGTLTIATAAATENLPTGGKPKRKTLPYAWWDDLAKTEEHLQEAVQAVAEAQKEIAVEGEVSPETVERLNTALWFADVDAKITALEAAVSRKRAQAQINAIQAEITRVQAEYERIRFEMEDEEAVEMLLLMN